MNMKLSIGNLIRKLQKKIAEQKCGKRTQGEKRGRGKKGKSKRKKHMIGTIVFVTPLILGYFYYQSQVRRYVEQQVPKMDCYYEYFARDDTCKFHVKNVGLVDCKNIWVEEKVFVIVDDEVYEGDDVPHFNYLVFNGSRTKMWDLPKDSVRAIELQELQRKAFRCLRERFKKAKIISKWVISFSSVASSKKDKREKYFIHAFDDGMPQELESYVGGMSIRKSIRDYLANSSKRSSKRSINIFDLTMDFELDTPTNYWIKKDYSIGRLFPETTLSIEDINNSLLFSAEGEAQPADDAKGSIRYAWKCKDGKWQKWTLVGPKSSVYTKPIRMLIDYLSKEDAERVRKDPKLIKSLDPDRKPVSAEREREKEKEIRVKALGEFRKRQQVD